MDIGNAKDIEEIKQDIEKARRWARKHFNVGQKEDHLLARPTFDIEYPGPNKIQVWPRFYGKRMMVSFTYTLIWVGEMLIWRARHPFHGTVIDLIVEED
jgi:hypothetical protein